MSFLLPYINPIRFHQYGTGKFAYDAIPSFEVQKGYKQIYFHGDRPVIQVVASGPYDWMKISLTDINGTAVGIWKQMLFAPIASVQSGEVFQFDFTFPDASIAPTGVYFLKMEIYIGASYTILYSEPIYLCAAYADTVKIVYDHDENDYDRNFTAGSALASMIRIEAGVRSENYTPAGKFTAFQDMGWETVVLSSQPYNIEKWSFGPSTGIPFWLADKINRIFGLYETKIDGVQYSRNEGAKMERIGDPEYPLAGWTLDLVKTENPASDEITTLGYVIGGTALDASNSSPTSDTSILVTQTSQ